MLSNIHIVASFTQVFSKDLRANSDNYIVTTLIEEGWSFIVFFRLLKVNQKAISIGSKFWIPSLVLYFL